MYEAVHQFYASMVEEEFLFEIEEDLVEIVTSLVVNKQLSPWLTKLCRLCTRDEESAMRA